MSIPDPDVTAQTVDKRALRPFTIEEQGHFHVEGVHRTGIRPGFRRWSIETEQKRPDGWALVIDERLLVHVTARNVDGGRTLYLRDGESGDQPTVLGATLPRTLPGREWRVLVLPEKWGVEVLAFTTAVAGVRGPLEWGRRVLAEARRRPAACGQVAAAL